MVLRLCGVVLGVMVAAQAAADSLDINLHSDALRASYGHALGANRGLDLDVGYLYVEEDDEEAHLAHVGLMVSGKNWSQSGNFDISLGGRGVFVDTKPEDGMAIAFGGRVRFSPLQRIGIGGEVFYAPKITSFSDVDSYKEWSVSLDYQLLTQGFVYVGYRKVEIDFDDIGDVEIDDNAHVGMKLLF